MKKMELKSMRHSYKIGNYIIEPNDVDGWDVIKILHMYEKSNTTEQFLEKVKSVATIYTISSEKERIFSFGKAVSEIKGDRSVRQMAKDTGIAASYISMMIKDKYVPSLQILKRITAPKSKPQGNVSLLDLIYLLDED